MSSPQVFTMITLITAEDKLKTMILCGDGSYLMRTSLKAIGATKWTEKHNV